jgi:hypothetical protein
MVRRRLSGAVSNHEDEHSHILRDAAKWPLLRMRVLNLRLYFFDAA